MGTDLTNDLCKIKKETGMGIGKLFYKDIKGEIELYEADENKDNPFLYDIENGNFHLLPNAERFQQESKKIIKTWHDIKTKLERLTNGKLTITITTKKMNGYFNTAPNDEHGKGNLFAYIRAKRTDKPEICYDLMFIRFFISNDNVDNKSVNCILNSFQFSRGDEAMKSYKLYPCSPENGCAKICGKYLYYNPPISFEAEPEEVAKEFLAFIMAN